MITFKLFIKMGTQTKELLIDKESFWISNQSKEAECFIEDSSIDISLHIFKEGSHFFVLNENNNPFIALNKLPFRKKELKQDDILHCGKIEIKIATLPLPETIEQETPSLAEEVPLKKENPSFTLEDLWKKNEISEKISPFATSDSFSPKYKNSSSDKSKGEKKDFLSYFPVSLRKLIAAVLIFSLGFLFLGLGFYSKALHSNKEEEKRAAGGVSDVAMALLYGQLNHLKPQKQNFADPNFIRTNLKATLSEGYPSLADLDQNRLLGGTSYILRIYTSQDASHYLIIAQPSHNLLQWLIPKMTIALDSSDMQLRKVEDIKTLNRLLAHPNPLDSTQGQNITDFLKTSPKIPLSSLAVKKDSRGFIVPKNIQDKLVADSIYNAPRYAPLTENVMNKAILLNENHLDKDDFIVLQEEIDSFADLSNLVFYTTKGSQKGWQALQALTSFFPKQTFIVSALTTNPDGTYSPHALLLEEGSFNEDPLAFNEKNALKHSLSSKNQESFTYIDMNHPLYFKLYALKTKREQELAPFKEEITTLLNENSETYVTDFNDHLDHLIEEYKKVSKEQNKILFTQIEELYQEYKEISFDLFLTYLKAFQLQEMAEDIMNLNVDDNSSSDFKKEMGKLRTEKLFQETKAKLL